MVRLGIILLVCAGLLLPVLAQDAPKEEEKQKEEFKYVGIGKCYKCHKSVKKGNQFEIWVHSAHPKAFDALGTEKAKKAAEKRNVRGDPQKADACLKCHSLQLAQAKGKTDKEANFTYPVEVDGEKKTVQSKGVECESCHGPGSAFKSSKIMKDPELARKNGLWDAKKQCVRCHDSKNDKNFNFMKSFKKIAHSVKDLNGETKKAED